jgi:hypothetical protein
MRVYLQPPQPSLGLERIATALRRYAPPSVEVLSFPRNADLTVLWAIGRNDALIRQAKEIRARGKQYVVIQVCLRSTMKPSTRDWIPLWAWAKCVWSYYDLQQACFDDGELFDMAHFYHAPLGVDGQVFKPDTSISSRTYVIISSGLSRLSESVRECQLAAKIAGRRSAHLGAPFKMDHDVDFVYDLPDSSLAWWYSNCQFVSGLRRKEGFELPAAEGLLCGARPICFDTPDYRWNYQDHAEYIEETDRQGVIDQLVQLFKRGARPVTDDELQLARARFNWETIVGGFWERCL